MQINETQLRRIRTTRFALSVYWLTMFLGTHMPAGQVEAISQFDKFIHTAAFAVLAFFIAHYRSLLGPMTRGAYLSIFVAVLAYAAFDEMTQQFAGREGDLLDWFADLGGALLGLVAFWLLDKRRQAKMNGV